MMSLFFEDFDMGEKDLLNVVENNSEVSSNKVQESTSQSLNIRALYIKNFKKFEHVRLNFSRGLNFLIGPNNAGKSTILQAVSVVLGDAWLNEESIDSSFFYPEKNDFLIRADIDFPRIGSSSSDKRINIIRNLKLARGNPRSKLGGYMVRGVVDSFDNVENNGGDYIDSIGEGVLGSLERISFTCYVKRNDDESYLIENYILLVSEVKKFNAEYSYIKIPISRQVRNNLLSFLFIPASRSENRQLFQVAPYTWLGKYLRYLQAERKEDVRKFFDSGSGHLFPLQMPESVGQIMDGLWGGEGNKIIFNLFDPEHQDVLFKYTHVFLKDPFLGEIDTKGHGMQSAVAIALFSGLLEKESEARPGLERRKEVYAKSHWATVLVLEEPESHFHPPVKMRLISLLEEKFVNLGAQVIISTHDDGFVKWPSINGSNLLFPSAVNDGDVFNLQFSDNGVYGPDGDSMNVRILRFQSHTIFSEKVLIVEGVEAVALDAMLMRLLGENFSGNAISIAQSVSPKAQSGHGDGGNLQFGGGASQIPDTVALYKRLHIKSACLIDIDCLFNGSIKNIIVAFGGNAKSFDFSSILPLTETKNADGSSVSAQKMRERIRSDEVRETLFQGYVNKLAEIGIFLFDKGDFEGNFKSSILDRFVRKDGSVVKEGLAYGVKYEAEMNVDFEGEHMKEGSKNEMKRILDGCKSFFSK
jgi:energy-coupling factor transporter ATP-binding protein EcfA2